MTMPMRDTVLAAAAAASRNGGLAGRHVRRCRANGRLGPIAWADAATARRRPPSLAKWREKANPYFPSQFPVTLSEGTHRWLVKGLLETPDRILFWVKTADRPAGQPRVGLFRFDFDGKSVEVDNIVRGEEGVAPGVHAGRHRRHARLGLRRGSAAEATDPAR